MWSVEFAGSFNMAPTDLEDIPVIEAMRSGDLTALGTLYNRYGEAVYRLSLRILKNPQEAEDLTQEVFLTFWRSTGFDPQRGTLLVYFLTITRSRAINRLRQAKSRLQLLQRWHRNRPTDTANVPMETASLKELSQQITEALHTLPENQRQILELAYYDGLSQSKIAEQLEIPLGTVKTRSRQGLLNLRKLLKDLV